MPSLRSAQVGGNWTGPSMRGARLLRSIQINLASRSTYNNVNTDPGLSQRGELPPKRFTCSRKRYTHVPSSKPMNTQSPNTSDIRPQTPTTNCPTIPKPDLLITLNRVQVLVFTLATEHLVVLGLDVFGCWLECLLVHI